MLKHIPLLSLVLFVSACEETPPRAVGLLESDRIELVAEVSEPIVSISATEGEQISAGKVLLQLQTDRVDARIAQAEAEISRIEAVLREQLAGPRTERIEAARARLREARVDAEFRQEELARLMGLRERNLTSGESVDQAEWMLESARARAEAAAAQLAELEAGTRQEVLDQTRGQLRQARARLRELQLDRRRLTVTAPADAVVDTLPFELGEQPRAGEVVAVLLGGDQPYARVYIPEALRIHLAPGDEVLLRVDGLEEELTTRVRRIASEASFTPYFALTESDRGRLSYVAELNLPDLPNRLPDGVPVEARFPDLAP